jgi:hypothetical protein
MWKYHKKALITMTILIILLIACIIVAITSLGKFIDAVEKHGIKNIISEIWEGPNSKVATSDFVLVDSVLVDSVKIN